METNKLCFDLDTKVILLCIFKRIKVFTPFPYFDYNRGEVDKLISKELSWQNTGAHYYDDLYKH